MYQSFKRHINLLYFIFFVILFTSCNGIVKSFKDTFNESTQHEKKTNNVSVKKSNVRKKEENKQQEKEPNYLSDTEYLKNAEAQLKSKAEFQGQELMLYKGAHFYKNGRIMLKLQDVQNPKYINQYIYYKGTWKAPEPVQLSKREEGKIVENLLSFEEFSFSAAARVYTNYNKKAKTINGAEPATHIYFIIYDDFRKWYPRSIDGERERWSIEFDIDGNVVKFERN